MAAHAVGLMLTVFSFFQETLWSRIHARCLRRAKSIECLSTSIRNTVPLRNKGDSARAQTTRIDILPHSFCSKSFPKILPRQQPTISLPFPSQPATKPRIGRDKSASIRRIGFFKPFENGWVISKPTPLRNGPPRPRLLHHKEPANNRVSRNRLTTVSPPIERSG
jgi:hypothetical protein